jgi:hypothetical protein
VITDPLLRPFAFLIDARSAEDSAKLQISWLGAVITDIGSIRGRLREATVGGGGAASSRLLFSLLLARSVEDSATLRSVLGAASSRLRFSLTLARSVEDSATLQISWLGAVIDY